MSMETLENRINAFVHLGDYLQKGYQSDKEMTDAIEKSMAFNPWFIRENIDYAFQSLGSMLNETALNDWISPYGKKIIALSQPKTVALIMAGNIPLVGFHDFLSVLITGHKVMAKLSSDDKSLLPVVARRLIEYYPAFADAIQLTEETIQRPDAVIATGSNNSARYFHYYFDKYPNIIRQNRNGIAVLSGDETMAELQALGEDIMRYFGLGCRNVSKIYVPEKYIFDRFFEAVEPFKNIGMHNKYKNNYDYYRSIYLIDQVKHFDNGFLMITADETIASPLSVLYYEDYQNLESLKKTVEARNDEIQCVVSKLDIEGAVSFGLSQQPRLTDYADGVNTLDFLTQLR